MSFYPSLCSCTISTLRIVSWKVKRRCVTQSCLTLCNPVNCRQSDSSIHGILQARILEWIAMPSQHRDRNLVSHIAGRFFTMWATREAPRWKRKVGQKSFLNTSLRPVGSTHRVRTNVLPLLNLIPHVPSLYSCLIQRRPFYRGVQHDFWAFMSALLFFLHLGSL